MIFLIIGLLGIFISYINCKSLDQMPGWVISKYIFPIYKLISKINGYFAALIGYIGAIIVFFWIIIALVANWENRQTVAQFNYNPCSMYMINDEIAEHRAFENDIFFGFVYSSDVADLPHIECRNHKIYKQIPRENE